MKNRYAVGEILDFVVGSFFCEVIVDEVLNQGCYKVTILTSSNSLLFSEGDSSAALQLDRFDDVVSHGIIQSPQK
jgi:hypothetical protein